MCQTIRYYCPSSKMTNGSSCQDDFFPENSIAEVISDDDEESGGADAFDQLKQHSERQRTTLTELENKKRKDWTGGKKNWLSVVEDCFSMSSLEVDLGSEYDEQDVEPEAEDRFRSSSRLDSMDFIPAQPLSSERDVRRVFSKGELRHTWYSENSWEGSGRSTCKDETEQPKYLGSTLRESRWSSSSDNTMRQDALNVLLDRVSSSHHGESWIGDSDTPSLTRRLSMADCEDRLMAPQTRKGDFPALTRRISSPDDQRWQGALSYSPQDSPIPSPSRFRR